MLLLPGLFGRKITKCLQPFVELPLCCDPLSQMVLIGDMAASQGPWLATLSLVQQPWLATLSNVQHRLWDHHRAQGATAKNTLKMVIWCSSVTFAGFLVPPICWAFLLFDSCHFRQDSQRSARRSSVDFGITTTEPKEGRQRSARRSSVDFAVTITEPKEDILEIWESENTNEKSCRRVRRGFATLNSIPFSEGGGASLTRTCELFKTTQFWWCIITPLKVLNGCNMKIIISNTIDLSFMKRFAILDLNRHLAILRGVFGIGRLCSPNPIVAISNKPQMFSFGLHAGRSQVEMTSNR